MKTHQCHGGVKDESPDGLSRTLPKGHRKVVLFTLMMHTMATPKQVYFVAHAMGPVIEKIIGYKSYNPGEYRVFNSNKPECFEDECVKAYGKYFKKGPGNL
jgi:hypothetical protein